MIKLSYLKIDTKLYENKAIWMRYQAKWYEKSTGETTYGTFQRE